VLEVTKLYKSYIIGPRPTFYVEKYK